MVETLFNDTPSITNYHRMILGIKKNLKDYPRVIERFPRIIKGFPRIIQKNSRKIQGFPRIIKGFPRIIQKISRKIQGFPRIIKGFHGKSLSKFGKGSIPKSFWKILFTYFGTQQCLLQYT